MYVKKFTGNSLDETLKTIKKELGPDAIIIKTETNKGIKGAFKKNRIEITAAISEREYGKKANVDRVLDGDLKEKFYANPAKVVADSINNYNSHDKKFGDKGNYGKLALNKKANVASMGAGEIPSLDEFLLQMKEQNSSTVNNLTNSKSRENPQTEVHNFLEVEGEKVTEQNSENSEKSEKSGVQKIVNRGQEIQSDKILELEKKVIELSRRIDLEIDRKPLNLIRLKNYLQSLDLSEGFIQSVIKKALFDLSEKDVDNFDALYEFTLKEMSQNIFTEIPLFSTIKMGTTPNVTVLISDSSVGQSSVAKKMASIKEGMELISYCDFPIESKNDFAEKMLQIKVTRIDKYNEIFYETKKILEAKNSVVIDFKLKRGENGRENIKKFIEEITSSFENSEIILCLSALSSVKYNKKVIETFLGKIDGLIFSHLDQTLSYSDLFNTHYQYPNIPLKFFSIGPVIPDDLEMATKERLISGIFKL